jgi:hypothetical protein
MTLSVQQAHPIMVMQPVNPEHISGRGYREIVLHNYEPYEPETHGYMDLTPIDIDVTVQANTKRPNLKSPTAYRWHHRMGCASLPVLKATHAATIGMTIQKGSMDRLPALLPCEACIAGKMTKPENPSHQPFTPLMNAPSTTNKFPAPMPQNMHVAMDLGIVSNTSCRKGNTCFALIVDLGVKIVYTQCLPSKGAVVHALEGYCQR